MATLHIRKGLIWDGLCDGAIINIRHGGIWRQIKAGDHIYVTNAWQELCPAPVAVYDIGFDMVNRDVIVTPNNPVEFEHIIDFKFFQSYPWGGVNDFTLQCLVSASIGAGENVTIYARNPLGQTQWSFAPSNPGVYINSVKTFNMNATNHKMKISGYFTGSANFQIVTSIISGGSPLINFSGTPFPVNYDSNS